jgi:hypothetical protein
VARNVVLDRSASVAIIFSATSGDDIEDIRWGLRLFPVGFVFAVPATVLVIVRSRTQLVWLFLPWFGLPYLVWLIAAPPQRDRLRGRIAYLWGLFGSCAFLGATLWALTRP